MNAESKPGDSLSVQLRLRIIGAEKITLGPGKIELLGLIEETGSLGKAAKAMGLSYMKAWSMIQTMKPLVRTSRGGPCRGGAKLTATGRAALALYQQMQNDCVSSSAKTWKRLQRLLRG
jgi:molybdate transport system regulatory protein